MGEKLVGVILILTMIFVVAVMLICCDKNGGSGGSHELVAEQCKGEECNYNRKNGHLKICSVPFGAVVYLNDNFTGKTTPTYFELPEGEYVIKLEKEHHRPHIEVAVVERYITTEINVLMETTLDPPCCNLEGIWDLTARLSATGLPQNFTLVLEQTENTLRGRITDFEDFYDGFISGTHFYIRYNRRDVYYQWFESHNATADRIRGNFEIYSRANNEVSPGTFEMTRQL